MATLADISSNGLLVRCDQRLESGTITQLTIGTGREAVQTMAVVRRYVEEVGIGFEFRNMSMTDRDLLRQLLLRLTRAAITR